MLAQIRRRVLAAIYWVNALDATSKSKYEKALHFIELHIKFSPENEVKFATKFGVYSGVLKSYVLLKNGNLDTAVEVWIDTYRKFSSTGLVSEVLKYLWLYHRSVGNEIIIIDQNKEEEISFYKIPRLERSRIDIEKVPPHVKRNFPMALPLKEETTKIKPKVV